MKTRFLLAAALALSLSPVLSVGADKKGEFPEGPVTYILGFSPGGKTDTQARAILPYVEKYLGASVTIQNVPGAGGRIGLTKVFKAKPDGYTIGLLPIPAALLGEYLSSAEYKTQEFTPLFACFVTPQVLVVAVDTYKDLEEFIRAGKSRSLTHATPGPGTSSHLAGIVTASGLGINEVRHVHYESSGPSLAALAGKHVDFSVTNTTGALPLVQGGKLKALLVMADQRDPAFPDVPTAKELGYNISAVQAIDGFGGPPGMPPERVKVLEDAFGKAASDPDFVAWAQKAKANLTIMSHGEFRRAIEEMSKELVKYKDSLIQK